MMLLVFLKKKNGKNKKIEAHHTHVESSGRFNEPRPYRDLTIFIPMTIRRLSSRVLTTTRFYH